MKHQAGAPLAQDAADWLVLALPREREAIRRAGAALGAIPGVRRVVVFGSRVRGDFHGESDLDILVVVDQLSCKAEVIHVLHDIEMDLEVPLSPVVFTVSEAEMNRSRGGAFWVNVEKEGVIIHDADRGTEN